jgi:hypothetical protein
MMDDKSSFFFHGRGICGLRNRARDAAVADAAAAAVGVVAADDDVGEVLLLVLLGLDGFFNPVKRELDDTLAPNRLFDNEARWPLGAVADAGVDEGDFDGDFDVDVDEPPPLLPLPLPPPPAKKELEEVVSSINKGRTRAQTSICVGRMVVGSNVDTTTTPISKSGLGEIVAAAAAAVLLFLLVLPPALLLLLLP